MATKRFTDAEKWKDPFFENLDNDYKLIWLYLLDDCDNAGIWKKSIKRLNFNCNTNVTDTDILNKFGNRIHIITEDSWFIPKFMSFQYGKDWETSNSKVVVSARKKLSDVGVSIPYQYPMDTPSIPYQYPIDTLSKSKNTSFKDKEYPIDALSIPYEYPMDRLKDKDKDKDKVKSQEQDKVKSQEQDKVKIKDKEIAEIKNSILSENEFDEFFSI